MIKVIANDVKCECNSVLKIIFSYILVKMDRFA